MRVVGAKGIVDWPGLQDLVTPEQASTLQEQHDEDTGRLIEEFPKRMLSRRGLDVLRGL